MLAGGVGRKMRGSDKGLKVSLDLITKLHNSSVLAPSSLNSCCSRRQTGTPLSLSGKGAAVSQLPWRRRLLGDLLYLFIVLLAGQELLCWRWSWQRSWPNEQSGLLCSRQHSGGCQEWPNGRRAANGPMGGVWALQEESSTEPLSEEPTEPTEYRQEKEEPRSKEDDSSKQDEIWDETEANKSAAATPGEPNNGRMGGQELLGELMRAMMSEAMADGDLDLASLFGELGLNASDFASAARAGRANLNEDDDDDEDGPRDDSDETAGDKWRQELGKLDLFGMAAEVRKLADRLRTGDVPRPDMADILAEVAVAKKAEVPSDASSEPEVSSSKDEL